LSEPALKGLAFEARPRASDGGSEIVWSGIAESADHHREVLARHRHGKGKWFAVIEATHTPPGEKHGETSTVAFEECQSQKEAAEAARRLLAKNAERFDPSTSIEARLYCDLEWWLRMTSPTQVNH
jgi:hypothetical protein